MTAMPRHRPEPAPKRKHRRDPLDLALAAEIRAEFARRKELDQSDVARAVFDESQQWLSRRLLGTTDFTGAEIKRLGDYLGIDIMEWYEAAKKRSPDPVGSGLATAPYPSPYLTVVDSGPEFSEATAPWGDLRLVV